MRSALLIHVSAIAAALLAAPAAKADQFKQAADGAGIDCAVSARELTRFALVGDMFASVSKISTGYPYNDFAVTNEPVRGDIYVSVPETFAARSISFFATTKKRFVYKFGCRIEAIPAAQVFISNPAIAANEAADFENAAPREEIAVRLIRAMANQESVPGYTLRQASDAPRRVEGIEVRLIAEYSGADLAGKVIRLANRSGKPVLLKERDIAPRGTLAAAITTPELAPGEVTTAYIVGETGAARHD
ncbi:conjugal transfer protein TraK [Novosphingobium sp. PC22D]|uniref:type-F conjugative transfer system secretin TraK n=1 Tax=Novosphingobium sp. PC22D TaxID=1962403 RepID=UPI000BF13F76|nr:type-F conjugative transfer system secretin TraK [Novosphingobium sp. PC22D]PEQ10337.1 conjugal transfer protein TraK [Novosphingobium sp. PC22D]